MECAAEEIGLRTPALAADSASNSHVSSPVYCRWARAVVRWLSRWAWRDELEVSQLRQNVIDDAQALIDALHRGESPDAYCGYGRDLQASNYRDELKWSLMALKRGTKS